MLWTTLRNGAESTTPMMVKPTVGRVVLVRGLPNFGTDVHCGLVQRVLPHTDENQVFINCIIFPDHGAPQNLVNVPMFENADEASDWYLSQCRMGRNTEHAAYWPTRG